MVSRRNVKPTLGDSVRRLFDVATKGNTGSPGVTVFGSNDGFVFQSSSGRVTTWDASKMIEVADRLHETELILVESAIRIDDANVVLEEADQRIVDASKTAELARLELGEGDPSEAVAEKLAASVGMFSHLVVTESAILNHTTLLGTTVAEELNVTGQLIGRDAIFTGTIDVAQLNVTEQMSSTLVSAMTVETKKLIATEEIIAANISIGTTGHELMQQGALSVAGPAGVVELTGSGYKAWNADGVLTANLNGYDNVITGSFQTAETGQRVRIKNAGSIAAVDLFASNQGDDHLGIWYLSASDPADSVAYIQAMPTLSNGPENPGINLYPNRGTFAFQGEWEDDSNSMKAIRLVNSAGLGPNEWTSVWVNYQTPFPMGDVVYYPMISVGTGAGVPVVATSDGHDHTGVRLQVNNLSPNKASGPIVVRVMSYRVKP